MFDALDIAEFDALVAESSPNVAVISRDTGPVDDGHGGQVEQWVTIATVACGVGSIEEPVERSVADALQGYVGVTITVPRGTDVKNTDLIFVGSQQYEVVGVAPPRSYESRRRVICRAIS
jgi:head-tail adaptor